MGVGTRIKKTHFRRCRIRLIHEAFIYSLVINVFLALIINAVGLAISMIVFVIEQIIHKT